MTDELRICLVSGCTKFADPDPGHEQLCVIHQAEQGTSRILTDDETYRRRSERASNVGPKTIELCAIRDCRRAANNGPFCPDHRRLYTPDLGAVTAEFSPGELDAIKAQVEADAAPLFVIALNWVLRQRLTELGITAELVASGIERIRGELEGRPE